MKTLPITLHNPRILLIGGGKVATHKANILVKNQIEFLAISKEFISEFPVCKTIKVDFDKKHIQDFQIIIDATGSKGVAEILDSVPKTFLLNRVDNPKDSDFFFNSLIVKDDLKISISTSGKSPKLGQIIRDDIEKNLPVNIGALLNDFGKSRENGEINISEIEKRSKALFGKVFLIGAGTGDPELLTIKAYKTIQKMDTIFFDHLISDEILEIIPQTVKIVSVGKQKGSHSKKQVEINKLMLDEVREGKKVGRLKAGDPYIFGRGGEEFLYLVENGVSVEVISGISSAISNGIPPTFRGLSSSFTVVSAHLKGNSLNLEWIPFLKMENHTLIVLMGLSRVSEIFNESTKQNISLKTQVLIISNISRKNEKRISTTLENIIIDSKKADRPAIMIFGRVVKLESQINKLG